MAGANAQEPDRADPYNDEGQVDNSSIETTTNNINVALREMRKHYE